MFYRNNLKKYGNEYKSLYSQLDDIKNKANKLALDLYDERKLSIKDIEELVNYLGEIRNLPGTIQQKLNIQLGKCEEFKLALNTEENFNETANNHSETIAAGGAAVGGVIAVMGADAAMAVATAFGTTSTGVAISSLSGAAAGNAALAWLGGGAIAAGGGGITAGSAFLAMAGPLGVGVAGVALVVGGIFKWRHNKRELDKLIAVVGELKRVIKVLNPKLVTLENLLDNTKRARKKLDCIEMRNYFPNDYDFFSDVQKSTLEHKIFTINEMATLINQRIF